MCGPIAAPVSSPELPGCSGRAFFPQSRDTLGLRHFLQRLSFKNRIRHLTPTARIKIRGNFCCLDQVPRPRLTCNSVTCQIKPSLSGESHVIIQDMLRLSPYNRESPGRGWSIRCPESTIPHPGQQIWKAAGIVSSDPLLSDQ